MLMVSRMDDYEMGDLLGRGGMGEVHLARDKSGRLVAIKKVRKTLSLDAALCERLSLEAGILRRIDHPNVVHVLDGGISQNGQPFVVMSRAFGVPLDSLVAQNGPFPRDRIAEIMAQILAGLEAIHTAGVIHADLKSSNILVDELDRATIIDFGLARVAQVAPEDDEIFGGTPAYMSPELLAGGAPTVTSDLYAAGVIFYEMLTGSAPLPRNLPAMMLLTRRMHETAEMPSHRAPERGITNELDAIIAKVLARAPEDRFTSATELATAISAALASWKPSLEDSPTQYKKRQPTQANLVPTLELAAEVEPATIRSPADLIISRALAASSARLALRDTTGAITTLEEGLARLAPTEPDQAITPDAWRIETVLAALYQSLGKKDHANRFARVAYQHAQRTLDPQARARTAKLVEQLSAQARLARGSNPAHRRG